MRGVHFLLAMLVVALPAHCRAACAGVAPRPVDSGDWEIEEFEGETRYRVVELDGRRVLEADSAATASSLYLERDIDIASTPVLEWSWRIEKPLAVDDERIKDGDDYAARVYVVAPGEGMFRATAGDQLRVGPIGRRWAKAGPTRLPPRS